MRGGFFVILAFLLGATGVRAEGRITLNGRTIELGYTYRPEPDWKRVEEAAHRIHRLFFSNPPAYRGAEEFLRRVNSAGDDRLGSVDKIAFDFVKRSPEFLQAAEQGFQARTRYFQGERRAAEDGALANLGVAASPISRARIEVQRLIDAQRQRAMMPIPEPEAAQRAMSEFLTRFPQAQDPTQFARFRDDYNRLYFRTLLEEVPRRRGNLTEGDFELWRDAQVKRMSEEWARHFRAGMRLLLQENKKLGLEETRKVANPQPNRSSWETVNHGELTLGQVDRVEIEIRLGKYSTSEVVLHDPLKPGVDMYLTGVRKEALNGASGRINFGFASVYPGWTGEPLQNAEAWYSVQYLTQRIGDLQRAIGRLRTARFDELPALEKQLKAMEKDYRQEDFARMDQAYGDWVHDTPRRIGRDLDLQWIGGEYNAWLKKRDADALAANAPAFDFSQNDPDWERKLAAARAKYDRELAEEWKTNGAAAANPHAPPNPDANSHAGTKSNKPVGNGGKGDEPLRWNPDGEKSGDHGNTIGNADPLHTVSLEQQNQMANQPLFEVHSGEPRSENLFFEVPSLFVPEDLKAVGLNPRAAVDLSIRNLRAVVPSNGLFPVPVPVNYSVRDARVRNANQQPLRAGVDFEIVRDSFRQGYFIRILRPQPEGGIHFEADLAKTGVPPVLPEVFRSLDHARIRALRGSLQAAGLTQLAAELATALDAAEKEKRRISLPELAAIFQAAHRATTREVRTNGGTGGLFGAVYDFTRNGRLCTQCQVASAVFDRYLYELFKGTPQVWPERVSGFLLVPGTNQITAREGHSLNRVWHLPELRFDLDTTPTILAEDEADPIPEAAKPPEPPERLRDASLREPEHEATVRAVVKRLRERSRAARQEILKALVTGHYFPLGQLDDTEPLTRAMRVTGALSLLLESPLPSDLTPILEMLRASFPEQVGLRGKPSADELLLTLRELAMHTLKQMEQTILRPGVKPNAYPKIRYAPDGVVLASLVRALDVVARDSQSLRPGALAIHAQTCARGFGELGASTP